MKGDFSRLTFDPAKQYTRVLLQQGRVQLDADWNEQADIFQHYLRTLAADLIGPFGAPPEKGGTPGRGFKLVPRRDLESRPIGFALLPGRYYVGGIAVENPQEQLHASPDQLLTGGEGAQKGKPYFLYLDVWERHVIYLQDELLREVALLGPDTATRSKVVWRVRATQKTPDNAAIPADLSCVSIRRDWSRWVEQWQAPQRGRLKAQARPGTPADTDPCLSSPEARYRGENQLYRVEIHTGGAPGTATYKWSADNGSVVFPLREPAASETDNTMTVTLEHLGRGDGSGLVQDDWVEIVDGTEDLRRVPDSLLKVQSVDADRRQVTLTGAPPQNLGSSPMLRRWDHRRGIGSSKPSDKGVYPVVEGQWLDLEDGVQIFFAPPEEGANVYRSGDYWVIPARVATGDVEWPGPPGAPEALPPRGVEHHYAPLGLLTLKNDDSVDAIKDCRTTFGARAVSLTTGVADWQVMVAPALPNQPAAPPKRPADVVVHPELAWSLIPGARWVSASPKRASEFPLGDYTFELTFDLCSCIHKPELWLDLLADNSAEVRLNNTLLGSRPGPDGHKGNPTHLNATDQKLFVSEGNVLQVKVHNEHAKTPTGFILHGAVEDGCRCG